jgi:hypothetical protein
MPEVKLLNPAAPWPDPGPITIIAGRIKRSSRQHEISARAAQGSRLSPDRFRIWSQVPTGTWLFTITTASLRSLQNPRDLPDPRQVYLIFLVRGIIALPARTPSRANRRRFRRKGNSPRFQVTGQQFLQAGSNSGGRP